MPLVLPHVDYLVVLVAVVEVVPPVAPKSVLSGFVPVFDSHVGVLRFVVAVGEIHRGNRDDGDNLAFDPGNHQGSVVEAENRDVVVHRG